MDIQKLTSIENYPIPTTQPELRRFLGLAGYYRRFIDNFSGITVPLNNLMHKDKQYNWDSNCQQSFDNLKNALVSRKILRFPDFEKPFILKTDASTQSIAAILSQVEEKGEYVISYASRTLTKHEKNYSASELECLALKWAVKHFRQYLLGTKFTVYTDHYALKWLMTCKDNNAKLSRWSLALQEYDFDVIHKPGKINTDVDALSRVISIIEVDDNIIDDHVFNAQQTEPSICNMIKYIEEDKLPDNDKEKLKLVATRDQFLVDKGVLFHLYHPRSKKNKVIKRTVLPSSLKEDVLEEYHCSALNGGHLGFHKTYEKIRDRFYWENMYFDILKYIKTCKECCRNKSPNYLTPEIGRASCRERV